MAGDIAPLVLELQARTNQLQTELKMAQQSIDNLVNNTEDGSSRMNKSFGGIGVAAGAVAGVVSSVSSTVISQMGQLASQAITASDATNKFKQTLNFAGIDPKTISVLTEQTRKYADQTVYDLATIQNTTAQLAANGVPNYEKLTEASGNLNAVAGGNSETFKSVAMVLTQTAGAGKLTTENWNQLANAIPGASGKVMEALKNAGAYTGNFRDAMAAGQITSEEFNAALLELGTQPVAVEAAKSTETFEGAIGNLQATIVGGLSDALNGMKPMLTNALGAVSSFIGGAIEKIKALAELLATGNFTAKFREAFNLDEDSPMVDFLLGLRDAFIGVFNAVKENWQIIQTVGAAILGAMVAFKLFNAAIELGKGIQVAYTTATVAVNGVMNLWKLATGAATMEQLGLNAAMLANPIGIVIAAVAALVAGLIWFFTQTELGKAVWENTMNAIGAAMTWVWESVIKPVVDAVVTAWSGLMAFFQAMWENVLKPVFDAIGAIFTWLYEFIVKPVILGIAIYIAIWMAIFTFLYENVVKPIMEAIGALFAWLYENVVVPFVEGVKKTFEAAGAVFTWLYENIVKPVFEAIGAAFQWLWENIVRPLIDNFIGGLKVWAGIFVWLYENIIKPVFDGIGTAFNWIWKNVIQPVSNFIMDAIHAIGDVVGSVFGGIGAVVTGAFSGVMDFFKGIINGFIDAGNFVADAINPFIGQGPVHDLLSAVGINITHLDHIPHLAEGGVVLPTAGGRIVKVAEAGEAEAVIPLSKMGQMGGQTIVVNAQTNASPLQIASTVGWQLRMMG